MKAFTFGRFAVLLASLVSATLAGAQAADQELRSQFREIDHDRNGFLSRYEYSAYYEKSVAPSINQQYGDRGRAALEKMHTENRRRVIDGPLESGDQNQDGRLSFAEFKAYHESLINR